MAPHCQLRRKNGWVQIAACGWLLFVGPMSIAFAHDIPDPNTVNAPSLGEARCEHDSAAGFPCESIDLLSFLALSEVGAGENETANDIWGWTDPNDGHEFAIVGLSDGTAFVDITDPRAPVFMGHMSTATTNELHRDIKVYQNYAYIVSEAPDHGLQIYDLTELRSLTTIPEILVPTNHYAGFGNSHNIAINEDTGFAYALRTDTCSGGMHMLDLADPINPVFAGCVDEDGRVHDAQCAIYHGPDAAFTGHEICINSNEDVLTIVDVTDKLNPLQLARMSYTGRGFTHQGWLTEDHRYFLFGDEFDELVFSHPTRTRVVDVSDLANPFISGIYDGPTSSIDHNLYVHRGFVYEANYTSGLRILRPNDVGSGDLTEVAYFDIHPESDARAFLGAWSVYPFFESGTVVVSGIESGVYVLRPRLPALCTPQPQTSCKVASRNRLSWTNEPVLNHRDRLLWRWHRGASTDRSEFGDPADQAGHALCIYAGSTHKLVAQFGTAPSSERWRAVGQNSYRYKDVSGASDGIRKVTLKSGAANRARIEVNGKGANLPDLALETLEPPIQVQWVVGDSSGCWGAQFDAEDIARQTSTRFVAKD